MNDSLPYNYSNFDAKLSWRVTTDAEGTAVEGVIHNVRYTYMENIEIWVTLQEASGATIARSTDYISRLHLDDSASFRVSFPIIAPPGAKLLFTYKYQGNDGGDGGNSWMQSFEAEIP